MTKNSSSRTHQPMQLDGGRLGKVEFHWTGDRYQHVWTFPGAGEAASSAPLNRRPMPFGQSARRCNKFICNRSTMVGK